MHDRRNRINEEMARLVPFTSYACCEVAPRMKPSTLIAWGNLMNYFALVPTHSLQRADQPTPIQHLRLIQCLARKPHSNAGFPLILPLLSLAPLSELPPIYFLRPLELPHIFQVAWWPTISRGSLKIKGNFNFFFFPYFLSLLYVVSPFHIT